MNAPLRIALLGNDPADQQWSMLNYGEHLKSALSKLLDGGGSVGLYAPDTRHRIPQLRRWKVGHSASVYWSRYVLYPKLLKGLRADIFHLLDHGNGWLAGRLDPARTVVYCHDLIPLILRDRRKSLVPWFSDFTFRQALEGMRRAAVILVNSERTRSDLVSKARFPEDRIRVVAQGIDSGLKPPRSDEERRGLRTLLGFPDGFIILHVGQNVFYKNIEGLIEAFAGLVRQKESAYLVRAGGRLTPAQHQLARRLNVADKILDLGPVDRARLQQLYRAADLLLLPSWYEGFGLPALEAMASGLPVVASNRGALPETVSDAGLIADPGSPDSFAGAARKILHDASLRDGMRQRGLARAAGFTWEKNARETLNVYRSILHA